MNRGKCKECELFDKPGLQKQVQKMVKSGDMDSYELFEYQNSGWCRRRSPTGSFAEDLAPFPIIDENEWCGEFKQHRLTDEEFIEAACLLG